MTLELKHWLVIVVGLRCCAAGWADDSSLELARPNLVLLMTDNQRADTLGCYGNQVIQTPNIDALAAGGIRFPRAYCTTSICAASRASILTGQFRRTHGYTFHQPQMKVAAMRDSKPLLEGDAIKWRQDFLHEHFFRPRGHKTNKGNIPRSEGIRTKEWKYISYFDETPSYEQLFDLKNDRHEVNNLAQDPRHRSKLVALRARMDILRNQAGPAWKPGR